MPESPIASAISRSLPACTPSEAGISRYRTFGVLTGGGIWPRKGGVGAGGKEGAPAWTCSPPPQTSQRQRRSTARQEDGTSASPASNLKGFTRWQVGITRGCLPDAGCYLGAPLARGSLGLAWPSDSTEAAVQLDARCLEVSRLRDRLVCINLS